MLPKTHLLNQNAPKKPYPPKTRIWLSYFHSPNSLCRLILLSAHLLPQHL